MNRESAENKLIRVALVQDFAPESIETARERLAEEVREAAANGATGKTER